MKYFFFALALLLITSCQSDKKKDITEDSWTSIWNGTDFTGWHTYLGTPFEIETGEILSTSGPGYSDMFGRKMVELATKDKKVVAITAAMPQGTGLDLYSKTFSDRFFDVGIAEQHAVTLAGGMASQGLKPVFAVYSTFLQRAYDQIIHDVCITSKPVTFLIDRAGRNVKADKEVVMLLQHMILAHHYEPEYGSPKRPMIPEAEMLHHLDIMDARMYDMQKALNDVNEGDFSDKIYSLDNVSIYKAKFK